MLCKKLAQNLDADYKPVMRYQIVIIRKSGGVNREGGTGPENYNRARPFNKE